METILDRLVTRGAVVKTLAPRSYRGVVEAEPVSAEEAAALPELEIVPDDDDDDMLAVPVDMSVRAATRIPPPKSPTAAPPAAAAVPERASPRCSISPRRA